MPRFHHATYFTVLSPRRLNTFISDLKRGSEITKLRRETEREESDSASERETRRVHTTEPSTLQFNNYLHLDTRETHHTGPSERSLIIINHLNENLSF